MAERTLPSHIPSILLQMQRALQGEAITRGLYTPQREDPETQLRRRLFGVSQSARGEFTITEDLARQTAQRLHDIRNLFTTQSTGPVDEDPDLNILETHYAQIYGSRSQIPLQELLITAGFPEADISADIHYDLQESDIITVDLRIDIPQPNKPTVDQYHSGLRLLTTLTPQENALLLWCLDEFRTLTPSLSPSAKTA